MRIAVTADVHLNEKYPERFTALKNVVTQINNENIKHLIIAGDLFDQNYSNHSEFEKLCKKNEQVEFLIIPGNHDLNLTQQNFSENNIKVYTDPEIIEFENIPYKFLFIPFKVGSKMVEGIIKKNKKLEENKWLLISHGDCFDGPKKINPYETGTYMPITSSDIEKFNPFKVILGHIHKRSDQGKVHYVGSPCSMDISETGYRKFSILDFDNLANKNLFITERIIDTDYIHCEDKLLVFPFDEDKDIRKRISEIIEIYKIAETDMRKIRVRMKVRGYYPDRKHLKQLIENELSYCAFYKKEGPNLDDVSIENPDVTRLAIAKEAMKRLENFKGKEMSSRGIFNEIKYNMMKTIFENK